MTGTGIQSSRAGGKCPKVRDLLEIKDLLSSAAGGEGGSPPPQLYHGRAGFPHWLLQMLKHWTGPIVISAGSSLLVLCPHLRLAESRPASHSPALHPWAQAQRRVPLVKSRSSVTVTLSFHIVK